MAGFQVEYILGQLNELRKEKTKNEQFLNSLQRERRSLEVKVKAAVTQHRSALDAKEGAVDALNVTERKLEHLEHQMAVNEESNVERRREVTGLTSQLDDNATQWNEECCGIEDRLAALAHQLRTAGGLYEESSLVEGIQTFEEEKESMGQTIETQGEALQGLADQLGTLCIGGQDKVWDLYGLPITVWLAIKDAVARECELLSSQRQQLTSRRQGVQDRYKELCRQAGITGQLRGQTSSEE